MNMIYVHIWVADEELLYVHWDACGNKYDNEFYVCAEEGQLLTGNQICYLNS